MSQKYSAKCRIYCNSCKQHTNHLLLFSYSKHDEDYRTEYIYNLCTCAGCDAVTLEEIEDIDYKPDCYKYYYPKREEELKDTKVFHKIPPLLSNIYTEVVHAYNEELNVLCAAGMRSLIEGICYERGIQGNDLPARINALESMLPGDIIDAFHKIRFMGIDAVHRLMSPDRSDLNLAHR